MHVDGKRLEAIMLHSESEDGVMRRGTHSWPGAALCHANVLVGESEDGVMHRGTHPWPGAGLAFMLSCGEA